MEITAAAVTDELFGELKKQFSGTAVHVVQGDILGLKVSAVVSPANSFGFMDGGVDQLYTERFGLEVQERLQWKISRHRPMGELLVGEALLIPTLDGNIPYVISAPTMRVPMILPKDTINPYLATLAALNCATEHKLKSVAFPGMGGGVGRVKPDIVAHQMASAYEAWKGFVAYPKSWIEASKRHQWLYLDKCRNLQEPLTR